MAAQPRWSQAELWDLFDLGPVSESDIGKYLSVTLARCVNWFRASGGSIFLENGQGVFNLRAKFGNQSQLPDDAQIIPGSGIAGIVAASGVARLIDDPQRHPDLTSVAGDSRIASSMVIPLSDPRRRVIGVLNISRVSGEPPFRDADLDQVVALAAHVALAVGNAEMVATLKSSRDATIRAHEQLVAVLDSVGGAVWVVDDRGAVVNENFPAAECMSDPANLVAQSLTDIAEAALANPTTRPERIHDSASGRSWLVRATPLESGGAVVSAQEVTEHEGHQREAARVKRLAEIGQMTAAIAHEIRNPLTGIRSAAQMIRQHPEVLSDFIGLIEEEALKLNDLCDEFLEFARPMQLNRAPVRLGDLAGQIVNVLDPLAREAGSTLEIEQIGPDCPIELDSRRIGQVLHNLIRNALEVTPPGGKVRIETESGTLRVRDWGPGMEQEVVEKLFSPFFTTKPDGTGLGLSNCKKIVDAHGGELSVESSVGEGTTFTVHLNREIE